MKKQLVDHGGSSLGDAPKEPDTKSEPVKPVEPVAPKDPTEAQTKDYQKKHIAWVVSMKAYHKSHAVWEKQMKAHEKWEKDYAAWVVKRDAYVSKFSKNLTDAAKAFVVKTTVAVKDELTYLNAYNAPHWVDIHAQISSKAIKGWTAQPTSEYYGVSWLLDAMTAANYAPAGLRTDANGKELQFEFNSATDANASHSYYGHSTHDLGMALDLGVGKFISKEGSVKPKTDPKQYNEGNQSNKGEALTLDENTLINTDSTTINPVNNKPYTQYQLLRLELASVGNQAKYDASKWDLKNAIYLSNLLSNEFQEPRGRNFQGDATRDFLALYDTSQEADRKVWLVPKIMNGGSDAQMAALFGKASQGTGVMARVHIGGTGKKNPYENINYVLGRLGIKSDNVGGHQTHFHVYYAPPTAVGVGEIKPQKLITAGTEEIALPQSVTSLASTESLIEYASALTEGEVNMEFNVDVPYVQAQQSNQQALRPINDNKVEIINSTDDCREVGNSESDAESAYNDFIVRGTAFSALGYKINEKLHQYDVPVSVRENTNIYVSAPPAHGSMFQINEAQKKAGIYSYRAQKGYVGKDTFVISVDTLTKTGKKVHFNLKFNVSVVDNVTDDPKLDTCVGMKFSSLPNSPISISWNLPIPVSFANLGTTSLGETVGQGITAQITLDTDAAGHGWFIDATPEGNEEFLPTSNPDVWLAKADSKAAGKMDMLSVLLHEYGHALGIEHSSDNADYMAASLQPGQRRLPSSEELSLMSRLVAALKTDNNPTDPNAPNIPKLPVTSLGLMALCRIRRSDYGWTLAVDKTQLVSRVDVNNLMANVNANANANQQQSRRVGTFFVPTRTRHHRQELLSFSPVTRGHDVVVPTLRIYG